jgi:hypothetical protein
MKKDSQISALWKYRAPGTSSSSEGSNFSHTNVSKSNTYMSETILRSVTRRPPCDAISMNWCFLHYSTTLNSRKGTFWTLRLSLKHPIHEIHISTGSLSLSGFARDLPQAVKVHLRKFYDNKLSSQRWNACLRSCTAAERLGQSFVVTHSLMARL